jgi:hypothetical protein
MPTIAEYLDESYREEVARVIAEWMITDVARQVSGMGGYYDAKKDGAILRLLNDRGCVSCEVALDDEREDFVWSFAWVPAVFIGFFFVLSLFRSGPARGGDGLVVLLLLGKRRLPRLCHN